VRKEGCNTFQQPITLYNPKILFERTGIHYLVMKRTKNNLYSNQNFSFLYPLLKMLCRNDSSLLKLDHYDLRIIFKDEVNPSKYQKRFIMLISLK
jgi:hypothetical protein